MIGVFASLSQNIAPAELSPRVRAATGQAMRRTAALHQLALLGALHCLPEAWRNRPTALLWQSASGPYRETLILLEEVCQGGAEPMPYDFLATQPALVATQIQAFVPGLRIASHLPLADGQQSAWALMLTMANQWLNEGRYAQVLCAQLDTWPEAYRGYWLGLAATTPEHSCLAHMVIAASTADRVLSDCPQFPEQLHAALHEPGWSELRLGSNFTRWPVFRRD
jgi:hypothetical protein